MELDRRKQSLLQAIVITYVDKAEPIGSQYLAAAQEQLGVRSATIRNELAEMTERGYLRQPHTSAGRIPSDLGYRYFVDHLMTWDRLASAEARTIRSAQKVSEGDLEQLLTQTCRVLTTLTRYTAVATPPTSETPTIRHTHLASIAPRRLLSVVVLENEQVVHRFVDLPTQLTAADITRLENVLEKTLTGLAASQVGQVSVEDETLTPSLQEALRSVLTVVARGVEEEEPELIMDGASRILDQPEFREADRVEPLVRFLEERRSAYETLRRLLATREVAVSIGQENPHEALHEVSVVAARYQAGSSTSGWVGVLGPTRMHYAQAVAAVNYAARALTETLSRLDR